MYSQGVGVTFQLSSMLINLNGRPREGLLLSVALSVALTSPSLPPRVHPPLSTPDRLV